MSSKNGGSSEIKSEATVDENSKSAKAHTCRAFNSVTAEEHGPLLDGGVSHLSTVFPFIFLIQLNGLPMQQGVNLGVFDAVRIAERLSKHLKLSRLDNWKSNKRWTGGELQIRKHGECAPGFKKRLE